MLVISRRRGERIQIGADVEIMVTQVTNGMARIAIKAPATVRITRGELIAPKQEAAK
jgi:carbon storage regulator